MAIFRAKNTLLREEHGQMARAKRLACQSLALAGRSTTKERIETVRFGNGILVG